MSKTIFLLPVLWLWLFPFHDFHVSRSQIELDTEARELQITLHIFLDDLEDALRLQGHDKLFLCTEREAPSSEAHLEEYLRERLLVRGDGEPLEFSLLGKEISDDLAAVWCYLLVEDLPKINSLEVTNEILMDLFDDQKNILSVKEDGRPKDYYLLQKGDARRTVNL